MEEEEVLDFDEDEIEFNQEEQPLSREGRSKSPTPPRPPHDSSLDVEGNKLPLNWQSRVSSTSGDVWYKNVLNGTSSWVIPKERSPTPPLPPPPATAVPGLGSVEVKAVVHPSRVNLVNKTTTTSHQG